MARKDALLKLHWRLQERRVELERALAEDLGDLRHGPGRTGSDDLDAAAESINTEMVSQLAQLESKELAQIHRAIHRLREGCYGTCEGCGKRIPVARLNALPYTTVCIECQRERESNPDLSDAFSSDWQKVFDTESATKDVSVNLADLEYNLG